jgi:hypothetical protein
VGQKAVQSGMRIVFLLLALGFTLQATPANAATSLLYCDPAIRQAQDQAAADAWNRERQRLLSGFNDPASFNSLFCGAQITNMFNSLGQSLISGIFSQIRSLIDNLMRQACAAAVAPLQMAANALCIPAFNFSLNYSLGSLNTGVCNGTPLFNVSPMYGPGYNYMGPTTQPKGMP